MVEFGYIRPDRQMVEVEVVNARTRRKIETRMVEKRRYFDRNIREKKF